MESIGFQAGVRKGNGLQLALRRNLTVSIAAARFLAICHPMEPRPMKAVVDIVYKLISDCRWLRLHVYDAADG